MVTAGARGRQKTQQNRLNAYISKRSVYKRTHHTLNPTNLCNILCWHNCIAHVPASGSWCQDGAWREVGEVGLDLRQWSCGHDQALLGLSGGYYLCCWCQGLRCNLQGIRSMNAARRTFHRKLCLRKHQQHVRKTKGTCFMVCAGTIGTDILTAPVLTTMGLAVGR